MRALTMLTFGVVAALAGCASEYHPEYHPVSSYTVNQSVSYPTIYNVGTQAPPVAEAPVVTTKTESKPLVDPARVAVVESAHLDRQGEVVGVLDVQDETGTHESGVALLRQKAAELGADAVVSVEFHRGSGGRPSRASGLAVRYDRGRGGRE